MAQATVSTGSLGSTWQIAVDLVSQDYAANTSVVHVRGILYNNSTVTSYNNNPINQYINGSGGWSQNTGMSVPAKTTKTMFDVSFTIGHDANGYAHVDFTAGFGATGTSGMGGPTSASVGMDLPRIPKRPDPPATYYDGLSSSGVHIYLGAPNDNGAGIDAYETYLLSNNAWPGAGGNVVASIGTYSLYASGLTRATPYYYTSRAHNSQGWSDWTPMKVVTTLATVPDKPGDPTYSAVGQDRLTISFVLPNNGGSAITDTALRLYNAAAGGSVVASDAGVDTKTSYEFTGLIPGTDYWATVQAANAVGWGPESNRVKVSTLPGVQVGIDGVYHNAIPFVGDGGTWHQAIRYIGDAGVWKL
jgi:hypothetical protein